MELRFPAPSSDDVVQRPGASAVLPRSPAATAETPIEAAGIPTASGW